MKMKSKTALTLFMASVFCLPSAQSVEGRHSGILHVYAGNIAFETCALMADARISCWGGEFYKPTTEDVGGADIIDVSVGDSFACAITRDTRVFCWGSNDFGQLGTSDMHSQPKPVQLSGADFREATAIAAGNAHACALKNDGTVWCWGTNSNGQLGNFNVGIGSSSSQPVQVLIHDEMATPPNPPLSNLIRITAGHDHSCAMLGNRTLACWGNDYEGELGNNLRKTNFDSPQAVLVQGRSGLETLVFADAPISAGSFHGCGLVADVVVDSVACWGHNFYGELGLGDNSNRYTANAAQDEAGKITNAFFVTAGYDSTCAILADSTIRCWGTNAKDQLGNPGVALGNNALTGVEVLTSDGSAFNGVFELAAGAYHFCALHETDTEVYCWGDNSFSQLGVFSATQTNVPQRVAIDAPLFTDNFDGN